MSARAAGWLVAAALFVAYVGIIGPMDYADEVAREASMKELRARLAAKPRQAEIAPLYFARCSTREFIAHQADGGRWRAFCVDADLSKREKTK